METIEFWRLIQAAKLGSGGVCENQARTLQALLVDLPPEQIVAFDRLFMAFHGRAYRWDLWGAAYIFNGGGSDDGFFYFRAWLIGQGEAVYENALKDPDTLADIEVGDDAECEELLYATNKAYEIKTGAELPSEGHFTEQDEPVGERWDEDALEGLYPRLCARYESNSVEEREQ